MDNNRLNNIKSYVFDEINYISIVIKTTTIERGEKSRHFHIDLIDALTEYYNNSYAYNTGEITEKDYDKINKEWQEFYKTTFSQYPLNCSVDQLIDLIRHAAGHLYDMKKYIA